MLSKKKLTLSRGLPMYISLSHDYVLYLIGHFFMGTSIVYVNFIVMCIMTYITLSWLFMNMKQCENSQPCLMWLVNAIEPM